MNTEMDKQNRRATRILRDFGRYVSEAYADLETPAIQRNKPKAHARIKRGVFARLVSRGKVKP